MAPESSPLPDLRRKVPRRPVFFAVELSSNAKRGRCGVTRNASGTGLLICTPSRFAVGDRLDLAVHAGSRSGRASAQVVRVEENGKGSSDVFRYRLAVELDGALSEELFQEARVYGPSPKVA